MPRYYRYCYVCLFEIFKETHCWICCSFGIFTSFGEFGPGDNIGLLASKTSATAIRGQYYGIAAAIGKIGAFVGTWVFPAIQKHYAYDDQLALQVPFYVSAALCLFSAGLTFFFCPPVGQDAINREDRDFVAYLKENGFDINLLGETGHVSEVTHESDSFDKEKLTPLESIMTLYRIGF